PPSLPSFSSHKNCYANQCSDVTSLHFQAAVPKYLRLEMQPASGTVVAAGGGGVVEQVVRITNSMQ
ncbi:unnamed protein product, partial [Laminaria digitata]